MSELLVTRSVSDATYARAVAALGEQGIVDILGVVGYYTSMSMILNATRTPPARASAVPMPNLGCPRKSSSRTLGRVPRFPFWVLVDLRHNVPDKRGVA